MAAKKKKGSMDLLLNATADEREKQTTRASKGYMAHKTEEWRSNYAHPEYMERAELLAEQFKEMKSNTGKEEHDV